MTSTKEKNFKLFFSLRKMTYRSVYVRRGVQTKNGCFGSFSGALGDEGAALVVEGVSMSISSSSNRKVKYWRLLVMKKYQDQLSFRLPLIRESSDLLGRGVSQR